MSNLQLFLLWVWVQDTFLLTTYLLHNLAIVPLFWCVIAGPLTDRPNSLHERYLWKILYILQQQEVSLYENIRDC